MTNRDTTNSQLHWSALSTELARTRCDVDGLAARFALEYGSNSEAVDRTEQLSAAIQRLEWAISRLQLRKISAAS
jgi:hypothetical protein